MTQNNANIGFEKEIWDAACVLWRYISAVEYRKIIVGFLAIDIDDLYEKNKDNSKLERDNLKSHILKMKGIPLLRMSRNKELGREQLSQSLNDIYHPRRR